MLDPKLEVVLTQTRDNRPLATVNNLPGLYVDLFPAHLCALAAALCEAADDCEKQPMDPNHFKKKKRLYDIRTSK